MLKISNMKYGFNMNNGFATAGIVSALAEMRFNVNKDVILCIGTDSVIGDSLAPLMATLLQAKNDKLCIYGTLNDPIKAGDVEKSKQIIQNLHNGAKILVVDAAVGSYDDIGIIKVFDGGIKPGLGVNKDMNIVGDYSIIGIVAEKKSQNNLTLTRLGLVYRMAQVIADGIDAYSNTRTMIA